MEGREIGVALREGEGTERKAKSDVVNCEGWGGC
jgi:hypothetical protein